MECLFQNKKKNIIAICFSVIYLVTLFVNGPLFGVTRFVIPVALLVLLFTANKKYRIKRWILPVAFALGLIGNIRTLIANIRNITFLTHYPLYFIVFLCSILITVAGALMFVGALLDFKRPLKYGALAVAVLTLVSLVVDFFAVGGFKYIQSVPSEYSPVNFLALAITLSQALFYIGLFVLATNKQVKLE